MFKKYNPKKIVGSWTGIPFLGPMDGTFIVIEMEEDAVVKHTGSQGDVTATLNANRSGTVTVHLIQGSPTNDALSAQVPNPDNDSLPVGALQLVDLNGTTHFLAKNAWIKKTAKLEYGDKAVGREWVFEFEKADVFVVGGNVL